MKSERDHRGSESEQNHGDAHVLARLTDAARDPKFRAIINSFDIVAPDGQPVRWLVNKFHKANLPDRCYGPELMIRFRELIAAGVIGEPRLLTADFGFRGNGDASHRLFNPDLAGGALLDVGVYVVSLASMIFGPPERGTGMTHIGLGYAASGRVRQREQAQDQGSSARRQHDPFDFHAGNRKWPRLDAEARLEWFYRLTQEPTRLWAPSYSPRWRSAHQADDSRSLTFFRRGASTVEKVEKTWRVEGTKVLPPSVIR
jgi:hypothetical protein